ncbi:potassium channel subfamily K member 1 isoform X1 [Lepeophtheirus salmonis]|uniref:Potassium channel domain-containing protein n=3 Tax=Lepeophtheirus salmonis TaxID=72036 RepID=A0A0K2T5S1_LEPSM|nr:potassium channel subfamily K member 1-like isoform X1 [Lepeophtheirus salmonis]XP_040576620.1 potassium channel subfamily K member 1-like isoform X1 [Lepeophtheirus salmonis]XP_040576622.1 potassium channel subfamily K member 1-like isoform X1 [Lepeophtheirus salmonis]XP_040576623.1 potassium channel subfamily K member 1-like isoform X1 [Lepeophtheirus salmonis]
MINNNNYRSIESLETSRSNNSGISGRSDQDERSELMPNGRNAILWCRIRRSTILFVLYIIGYISYIVCGAYIMFLLETDLEKRLKETIVIEKQHFLKKHPTLRKSDLEDFLESILGHRGISPLAKDQFEQNWSLGQSILYTSTVITTIGYGHISPLTIPGKIFTILYASFGIPFTIMFISIIAKRISHPIMRFLQFIFSMMVTIPRDLRIKSLEMTLMFIIIVTLFHVLPAIVFTILEPGWNFLDAVYYTFISLTTIGLGDYIPGDKAHGLYRAIYKCGIVVYLLLGLIMMTLIADIYYGIPELSLAKYFQKYVDIDRENIDSFNELNNEEREKSEIIRPRSRSSPR